MFYFEQILGRGGCILSLNDLGHRPFDFRRGEEDAVERFVNVHGEFVLLELGLEVAGTALNFFHFLYDAIPKDSA